MHYGELKFLLSFLSCKNRHLWRHHYLGSQGVILNFCDRNTVFSEQMMIDTINIFKDPNLIDIPFLVLFDKEAVNSNSAKENTNEKLRSQLLAGNYLCNFQNINFNVTGGMEEIYYGLDWLCDNMKPL